MKTLLNTLFELFPCHKNEGINNFIGKLSSTPYKSFRSVVRNQLEIELS